MSAGASGAAAALVGGLLFVGGNGLVAWSETRVDTGIAALLIAAVPLWMALFDRVANGQGLSRSALLGLLVGFGGVALLAWPSGPSRIDALGAVALLVSGAAWAAGSLVARGVRRCRGGRSSHRGCRCSRAACC